MLTACTKGWDCYATARKWKSVRACKLCRDLTIVTEKAEICALCWPNYIRGFDDYHPCTGPECVRLFLERKQLKEKESALLLLHMGQTSQPSQPTLPSPAGWVLPTIQLVPDELVRDMPVPAVSMTSPLGMPPKCPPPPSAPTVRSRPGLFVVSTAQQSADEPWTVQPRMDPWTMQPSTAAELRDAQQETVQTGTPTVTEQGGMHPGSVQLSMEEQLSIAAERSIEGQAQPSTAGVYTPAARKIGGTQGMGWQQAVHTIIDRLDSIEEKVKQLRDEVQGINEKLAVIKMLRKHSKEEA